MGVYFEEDLNLDDKGLVRKLKMAFGVPEKYVDETKYLAEILQRVISAREADMIASLGGKAHNLKQAAEKLGRSESEAKKTLKELRKKGVMMSFPDLASGEMKYKATTMILLHDLTLLNTTSDPERFDEDFLELWDNFYKEIMVPTIGRMGKYMKDENDAIFRVIPVNEAVTEDHVSQVLPYETIAGIIAESQKISLQPCICRTRTHGKNCNHIVADSCMAFDMMADMVAKAGHGRLVSKEEALAQLKKTTEDGLVHLSGNSSEGFAFICSCCQCCCGVLYAVVNSGHGFMARPSRYTARVDQDLCNGCETCEDCCNFKAVSILDGMAGIDAEKCWGCGVCAFNCPEKAISLDTIHDQDFIPRENFLMKIMKNTSYFK